MVGRPHFDDIALSIDSLRSVEGIDLDKVVSCGHSAGGHLALWAASRGRLPKGAPGARSSYEHARVEIRLAISLAGVVDLEQGARLGLGQGAIENLVGGGLDSVPDRYRIASPAALLPIGVEQLLIHGDEDETVPISMSKTYVERARALGDEATFVGLERSDHMDVIDPHGAAWKVVIDRLELLRGGH